MTYHRKIENYSKKWLEVQFSHFIGEETKRSTSVASYLTLWNEFKNPHRKPVSFIKPLCFIFTKQEVGKWDQIEEKQIQAVVVLSGEGTAASNLTTWTWNLGRLSRASIQRPRPGDPRQLLPGHHQGQVFCPRRCSNGSGRNVLFNNTDS